MAPYALALGIINPFSANFARRKLDHCPYLVTEVSGRRTAEEWGQIMGDIADLMDALSRRMMIEKWVAFNKEMGRMARQRKQSRPAKKGSAPRKNPQPKKK